MDDCAPLVAAILSGEVQRFSEIVTRYDAKVRRIVRASVRDADSCEELVQQTFYLAFKRLDSLNDPTRLDHWLARIARNCVTDHHRRLKRHRNVQWDFSHSDPLTHRDPEPSPWIWDEVSRLHAPFRQVLELRYRQGQSYKEIAAGLQVPLSTVRGRIYEARRALRNRLEEGGLFP